MNLKERIQETIKSAMKGRRSDELETLRFLWARIKRREVDQSLETTSKEASSPELTDAQIIEEIEKLVKEHRDSIEQAKKANREEIAKKEQRELEILQTYLPTQLTEKELMQLIEEAMQATQATGMKDMGKLMAYVKEKAKGRVDMSLVSTQVKDRFSR